MLIKAHLSLSHRPLPHHTGVQRSSAPLHGVGLTSLPQAEQPQSSDRGSCSLTSPRGALDIQGWGFPTRRDPSTKQHPCFRYRRGALPPLPGSVLDNKWTKPPPRRGKAAATPAANHLEAVTGSANPPSDLKWIWPQFLSLLTKQHLPCPELQTNQRQEKLEGLGHRCFSLFINETHPDRAAPEQSRGHLSLLVRSTPELRGSMGSQLTHLGFIAYSREPS